MYCAQSGPCRRGRPWYRYLTLLLLICPVIAATAQGPRIGGSAWVVDAPTKIAATLGLFDSPTGDAPARVDYYSSGQHALDALLAGDVEYALAAPVPVAMALLDGVDKPDADLPELRVLASVGLSNQSHYLLVHGRADSASAAELVGRRVGLPVGTSAHFTWATLAQAHGLDEGDVELVDLQPDQHASALAQGEVDAVMTWDPFGKAIVGQLGDRVTLYSTRSLHSVNWLLVTRRDQLVSAPDTTRHILGAYLEAVDLIHRDPQRARALHARATGLPEGALAGMEAGVFWKVTLGWSVMTNLETVLRWQHDLRGRGDRPVPGPEGYLAPAPLHSLRPDAVVLPAHVLRAVDSEGGWQ